jgi:hypothetical protein
MRWPFAFHRPTTPGAEPEAASEQDVLNAGDDFSRKEKLVERFTFLPADMKRAAKDTALNRFLDVLFSHLRK